ncbi:MAG: helix-turn-helix transcriptional regulator [Methanomicrobiales archaeon]|nr:helix-turn-helix transcriptional regulator [Methanomicrobiales archaeon]
MAKNHKKQIYNCPVEASIDIIGGKWKPVILWHIRDKPLRFTEIRTILPDITQGMLTRQLRELEADLVINRKVFAEVPPRVEYSLTDFGKTVIPILDTLCEWGKRYLEMNSEMTTDDICHSLQAYKQKPPTNNLTGI